MIIGFTHRPLASGGPGSFQTRFMKELRKRGHTIVFPEDKVRPDVIVVLSATRRLFWLIYSKLRGVKILHRLGAINWRHRIDDSPLAKKIKPELIDLLKRFIRFYLADHVVYQSEFSKKWWHRIYGKSKCPESVIYNSVDLKEFKPHHQNRKLRLICVEGSIPDDPIYMDTLFAVSRYLKKEGLIEKIIVAGVLLGKNNKPVSRDYHTDQDIDIAFLGKVSRTEIMDLLSDGIFLSLEINPACPNSVIEALASGVPVLSFDTGPLTEIVSDGAGEVASYENNVWHLEKPNVENLFSAAKKIIMNFKKYSQNARKVAESKFDVKIMTDDYLDIIVNIKRSFNI